MIWITVNEKHSSTTYEVRKYLCIMNQPLIFITTKIISIFSIVCYKCWWWNWNIPDDLGQYHGCWWPGSLCRQAINNLGIDYAWKTGPCLPWGKISITYPISVSRNYRKYKYIFMSLGTNSVWQGINFILKYKWKRYVTTLIITSFTHPSIHYIFF